MNSIDYFISSVALENDEVEQAQSHYTEHLVRLSHPPTYLYRPQAISTENRIELNFAKGKNIYTCPQALFKILPEFDYILISILRRDPNGILIFIEGKPNWSDILMSRWNRIDKDVTARIFFLPRLDQGQFFYLLRKSSIILDTVGFSGGITSAEALSQGTPIITWPRELLVSRVTYAYLKQIDVLECVADSAEDYIEKALYFTLNSEARETIVQQIKKNAHLLFERVEVVSELKEFFISSLERWRS